MALLFDASTERVTYTAPFMGDPSTLLAWIKPNTVTAAFRQLAGQLSSGPSQWRWATSDSNGSGQMRLFLPFTGGTNLSYYSTTGFLVQDVWNFIAFVVDTSLGVGERGSIYRGSLTTAAIESTSYPSPTTDGVGSLQTTEDDLELGGDGDGDGFGFEGDIATLSVWPGTALTLAQIVAHQYATVPKVAGAEIFSHFQGGQAANWAGASASVNGTITGATQADHVPLGPIFGADPGERVGPLLFPTILTKRRFKTPIYRK